MVAIPLETLPPLRVQPAHDRSSMQRKVTWLAEHGYWRALEAIKQAHGWDSQEVRAWMDAHLPVAWCARCGACYYDFSRRAKYCSDRCRRNAAAHREYHGIPALPPVPEGLTSYFVRLVRYGPGLTRTYELRLLPTLTGEADLASSWTRVAFDHRPGFQHWTWHFTDVASAEAAFIRRRDDAIRRGYREETV